MAADLLRLRQGRGLSPCVLHASSCMRMVYHMQRPGYHIAPLLYRYLGDTPMYPATQPPFSHSSSQHSLSHQPPFTQTPFTQAFTRSVEASQ